MKKYRCKKCKATFGKRGQLGLHYRWNHPKRKLGQPKAPTPSNGILLNLADMNAKIKADADIIAAILFLRQFGTVNFCHHETGKTPAVLG